MRRLFFIHTYQEGTFSSKIKLTDLQKKESVVFNLDIFAQKPSLLRLEVTTPIGFHIASLTLNGDQATLIIPSKKIHRQGITHSQILEDVIPLKIDPQWMLPILFETPLSDWQCDQDDRGYLKSCQLESLLVTWTKRMGYQRTLHITSQDIEAVLYIQDFKPYLPPNSNVFVLP